jgi:hypothetical protein
MNDNAYEIPIVHEVIVDGIPVYDRNVTDLREFLNDRAEEDGLSRIADINIINRHGEGGVTHGYFAFENIFDNLRVVDLLWYNGKVFKGHRIRFRMKNTFMLGVVTPVELAYVEDFKRRHPDDWAKKKNKDNKDN